MALLLKKKNLSQTLGVSYIPWPNRIRFKSTSCYVIANLETILFTYRRLERKTVLLPYFFFTMLMHSYFYVLITTVFYPFNCYKGNNIYGEEIRRILLRTPESRSQFILMDRIQPKLNKNILVRQDTPVSECIDVIPELGIVGIIIRYVPSYRGE